MEVQRLTVRPSRAIPGLLLATPSKGRVEVFETPQEVVDWVRRRDAARSQKDDIDVATIVDWCDMPDGFVPPG